MNKLKHKLQKLNQEKFSATKQRTEAVRIKLCDCQERIQQGPNESLIEEEMLLSKEYAQL